MKKKILPIIIMLIFLTSCGEKDTTNTQDEVPPKYVSTQTIEEKGFSEQIKLPGKISASKETSVSSLAGGIINSISVKVGDTVKAGDILATIDTTSNLSGINLNNAVNSYNNAVAVYNSTKTSLEKTLESAQLQYDNAKIARNNTYSSTEKQLELAKAQLDAVKTQKGNTGKSSNTSLDLAEKSLENAKLNLDNFLKNSDETLKTLKDKKESLLNNMRVAVEGGYVLFDSTLNDTDKILGVTDLNKSYNDDFDVYLSAKNSALKTDAKDLFTANNNNYKTLKKSYDSTDSLGEKDLIALINSMVGQSTKNISFLDKMTQVLNNSVTSPNFSEQTLSSYKNMITSYQSQFTNLKSNLTNLNNSYTDVINSINSTNTNLVTQKATLEQAIRVAQATYDNTKANINTSLDSVSSSENTTRIQYESTIESVRAARETSDNNLKMSENQLISAKANYNAQLASLKSQVDSASGQKNSLGQQIENSQIKAPYDGVIISKNIEIGSTVGQGTVAFLLANSEEKVVKMDVNSDNIKYLQVGKEVSFGKGSEKSKGHITLVGAGANSNSMYPVEMRIDEADFASKVVLGDFIDVYIDKVIGEEKYIIVPFSALVAHSNGIYTVYVVGENNIVEDRKVDIGSSNSNEVIIRSGLKLGEKVVINGTLNISVGDKVEEK